MIVPGCLAVVVGMHVDEARCHDFSGCVDCLCGVICNLPGDCSDDAVFDGNGGVPVQDDVAVADGKVVYSGNGLAGYGNLIIIKHSETYLSAYAYCQERLVEEGTLVKAGKQVARMGQKDDVAMLHFEIRRNGKPVDPLKYLPKQ